MHGRIKVKTSEEQQQIQKLEKEKKIRYFNDLKDKIISARKRSDYSKEVLDIISECVLKAPEWNLFWNYRREILLKNDFNEDLMNADLKLTALCLRENPKAYAVWHHRVWIMLNHLNPDWQKELELCNIALKEDERNFHCWDYRRFVVEKADIPTTNEFSYSHDRIIDNISNYSSWHYRSSFLQNNNVEFNLEDELDLLNNAVFTDPSDQSPWFYLRWLMTYNRKNTFLRELYVSKSLQNIVLIVSEPVSKKYIDKIKVSAVSVDSLNGVETVVFNEQNSLTWKPILNSDISSVWLLSLKDVDLEKKLNIFINQTGDNKLSWKCELRSGNQESLIRVETNINRILCDSVSNEIPIESIREELKVVRELQELEPDSNNKWVLLMIISILRILSPIESFDEIIGYYNDLKRIDSIRSRLYSDMCSRFRIECELINLYQNHKRDVSLNNSQLTLICHLDWMTLMTHIDLSHNDISALPDECRYLICVVKLNLSHNRIRSLGNLRGLPALEHLNVHNNCIATFDQLEPVFYCKRLTSLNIKANSVSQLSDLTNLIATHPASKFHIDNLSIIYHRNV